MIDELQSSSIEEVSAEGSVNDKQIPLPLLLSTYHQWGVIDITIIIAYRYALILDVYMQQY